jgi:hypothetical protein
MTAGARASIAMKRKQDTSTPTYSRIMTQMFMRAPRCFRSKTPLYRIRSGKGYAFFDARLINERGYPTINASVVLTHVLASKPNLMWQRFAGNA